MAEKIKPVINENNKYIEGNGVGNSNFKYKGSAPLAKSFDKYKDRNKIIFGYLIIGESKWNESLFPPKSNWDEVLWDGFLWN